jgi:hypothetical protein
VLLPSAWSAPHSNLVPHHASFMQLRPTPVPCSASIAGTGATQQKLVTHKLHAACDALVLILRPTIANLPAAAEETPQRIPPSPPHQRELHALILPTVSTAKGNTVWLTDNALTGSTTSTGPGFPHGSLWPWMGQMSTQHFSNSVRICMPEGGRGASAETLGDNTSAPLPPACQQMGKEHRDTG